MNRLDALKNTRPIRISYVIPGYPTYEESLRRAKFLLDLGIEVLEIGVPFSDPVADGPIIREASEKAIADGITLKDCIAFCHDIRAYTPDAALVLMSYLNPLHQYGLGNLNHALKGVVDGVIIPDSPFEECGPLFDQLTDLHIIQLITLSTGNERLLKIASSAKGFIYLVAVKGTTGGKEPDLRTILPLYDRIRPLTQLPIIAGFGIHSVDQVQTLSNVMDGFIIASEIIKAFDEDREAHIQALFA